jgi:large subunit ribosomal protein L22
MAGNQFKAIHRYARISARKVRLLANLVRGKTVVEALSILEYQPQRGAVMLKKVIESALGNAMDPDQSADSQMVRPEDLVITDVRVDGGPMFKRMRPRSRGMAHTILKRTSHIQVTLGSDD